MTTNAPEAMSSGCVPSDQSLYQALRATYMGIDFALTLLGNLLTIAVARRVEDFSDSTQTLIASLALADLGTTFVVATSLAAEISGEWIFPEWLCTASFVCFYTLTAVSVLMIIIMTFDRLVAVMRPLRYSLIVTKRRSTVIVVFVWLGCTLGSIITTSTNKIKYDDCSAFCVTARRTLSQSIASLVTFYITPLVLIMVMNIKLLLVARRHANCLRRSRVRVAALSSALKMNGQPQHQPSRSIRGKAVGVTALITFAFAFNWLFFYVTLIRGALTTAGDSAFPEWVEFTAVWLALSNSWWNVIIYSIMNRSFRRQVKSFLLRLVPRCHA